MKGKRIKFAIPAIAATLLLGCAPGQVDNKVVGEPIPVSFKEGIKYAAVNTNDVYQLTAVIEPEYAFNKNVIWSIDFDSDDASSTDDDQWKVGEVVTNYVKITTEGNVANVSFVAPFGSQIAIKATAEADPDVFATCTVNYYKRMNATLSNRVFDAASGNELTNPINFVETIGTKPYQGAKTITYKYGANFYWYGSAYKSGVVTKVTDTVNVSDPSYQSGMNFDLIERMSYKISQQTTKTLNLATLSRVLGGGAGSKEFINTLYHYIKTTKAAGTVANADLYIPVTAYCDGVQYNDISALKVTESGVVYSLVRVDVSGVNLESGMTISFADSQINY